MELNNALGLPLVKGATALVGGGGKTSLMYALSREYADAGLSAIISTTTRIGEPPPEKARLIEKNDPAASGPLAVSGEVVCIGEWRDTEKLGYPGNELWRRALGEADRVFTEADGAKRLPVKAPADHEPCLDFEGIDTVVGVAGLGAMGKALEEVGFRLEIVCRLLSAAPEALLTPEMLAFLLTSPQGQFKNVGSKERYRVFLNQADNDGATALGRETARYIKSFMPGCRVVIGALEPSPRIVDIL